jgi:hypothetical protein
MCRVPAVPVLLLALTSLSDILCKLVVLSRPTAHVGAAVVLRPATLRLSGRGRVVYCKTARAPYLLSRTELDFPISVDASSHNVRATSSNALSLRQCLPQAWIADPLAAICASGLSCPSKLILSDHEQHYEYLTLLYHSLVFMRKRGMFPLTW